MNEIKKEIIIRAGLLGLTLSGVAGIAPSSHEGLALAKSAYADDGFPEKWSPDMTRLAFTQEIRDQGDFSAHLNKGEILIITSRGVNALGNSIQVPENDSNAVAVTVVVAAENVDVPFSTLGKGTYAWVDLAKTSDTSFDGMVKAAVTAGEVKFNETVQPGQCGLETGCGFAYLNIAVAHLDSSDSSKIKYDSVMDNKMYMNQSRPKITTILPNATSVPIQQEAASQVPEFPKNILEASAIFGGRPENWQQNTDGGWFLSPLPDRQKVLVNPQRHMMEGTTENGLFVCGGNSTFEVFGVTIWNKPGNQENVTDLYLKVKQNNPDKLVTLIP